MKEKSFLFLNYFQYPVVNVFWKLQNVCNILKLLGLEGYKSTLHRQQDKLLDYLNIYGDDLK